MMHVFGTLWCVVLAVAGLGEINVVAEAKPFGMFSWKRTMTLYLNSRKRLSLFSSSNLRQNRIINENDAKTNNILPHIALYGS